MKSITFDKGILTQYDGFDVWLESITKGANAVIISRTRDTKITKIQNGTVLEFIDKSDFKTNDEYDNECIRLINEYDTTAEFITDKLTIYVGIKTTDIEFEVEDIKFNNVYYC